MSTTIPTEIATMKAEITKVIKRIAAKEIEIEKQHTVFERVKENIQANKIRQQKTENTNKAIVKKYEDTFNIANRNRYSVKQEPFKSK